MVDVLRSLEYTGAQSNYPRRCPVGGGKLETKMKKILILMMSGGGGHMASAKAIAGAVACAYGDEVSTSIVDLSKEHWSRSVNRIDEVYRWMERDGLWVWKALWRTSDKPKVTQVGMRLFYPFFYHPTKRVYLDQEPDLVVGVHSLVNHIPLRVLRKGIGWHIPFVTVVTDMVTVHPTALGIVR